MDAATGPSLKEARHAEGCRHCASRILGGFFDHLAREQPAAVREFQARPLVEVLKAIVQEMPGAVGWVRPLLVATERWHLTWSDVSRSRRS